MRSTRDLTPAAATATALPLLVRVQQPQASPLTQAQREGIVAVTAAGAPCSPPLLLRRIGSLVAPVLPQQEKRFVLEGDRDDSLSLMAFAISPFLVVLPPPSVEAGGDEDDDGALGEGGCGGGGRRRRRSPARAPPSPSS